MDLVFSEGKTAADFQKYMENVIYQVRISLGIYGTF